jgi:2-haloalkanoic acid dehalogenase type II
LFACPQQISLFRIRHGMAGRRANSCRRVAYDRRWTFNEGAIMELAGVRALVFDVFGTVVNWREGVARDAAAFLTRHGHAHVDPAAFADAWRRRYAPAMEQVRAGKRPFVRLDVLHRENLEAILPEFGVDSATIAPGELDALNLAWHRLDPWPDSVGGLVRLKAGYIIAPLSNGNIILMLDMAKRAGLPWRDPGRGNHASLQTGARGLPACGGCTGHAAGRGVPRGRAQQRPGGRKTLRPQNGLRAEASGTWPGANYGLARATGVGHRGR